MALSQARLKEYLDNFDDLMKFKNKKQTFEETKRFWSDMATEDKLTSYIISLICRVITLDTIPSDTKLFDIYDALILKCDSRSNYESWTAALIKEKEKDKKSKTTVYLPDPKEIVQLRTKILLTLNFIVNFYPEGYNIGQIATLISRWKIARESNKLLEFEQKTISLWGDIDSRDVPKILRKGSSADKRGKGASQQISILIKQCVGKMKRGMGGQFPDFSPSLCVTGPVCDSLCYLKLISLLEQHPVNYVSALSLILQALTELKEEQYRPVTTSVHSHNKPEDKERLLPYLQLFREFVTRAPSISNNLLDQAYKTVYGFFLWPVPYCHSASEVLNFIDAERICPGFSYRNRVLSEHNIPVKGSTINSVEKIHLLIDYAAPQALSLREVFKKTQGDDKSVKIHLLMRAFIAIKGVNVDLEKLEKILKTADSEILDLWLSEYINNTHEVLYEGLVDSQDIIDKHLTLILEKMVAFFNEKNPDEKIGNLNDIIENPNQTKLEGFGADILPQTPIHVRFLNSLMEPKSPEDIIDEILADGTGKSRGPLRGKIDKNRPQSMHSSMSNNSFADDASFLSRTGSGGNLEVAPTIRQMTVSEKVKNFQKKKRNESQSLKDSAEETEDVQVIEQEEVGKDDVIFVDIFGNIVSAKENTLPRTKRGILTQELREGRAILKLVIAGDDKSVAMVMKAYLLAKSKHQMYDTEVQFYYIPLSNAETVSGGEGQLFAGTLDMGELQDPLTKFFYENQPSRGGDIWMGRLLGHLDGWYENFVTLPIHCALQLLPQFSLYVDDSGDVDKLKLRAKRYPKSGVLPHSPVKVIRDTIVNYTREATQLLTIHNYYVEMTDNRGTRIECVMCHRLELITRDPNQKSTQVGTIPKPASIRLTLHAIQLDGTPYPLIEVPYQKYFVLKASNVPKPGDFWAANPADLGFEVHAVVAEKVGGGALTKSRYGPSDQRYNWYVKQVVIEAQEKETFHVSIDKENPHGNVRKLIIRPTRLDMKSIDKASPQFLDDFSVSFKTYWPVDL